MILIFAHTKERIMSREETNKLKYTIALIAEFAEKFGIGEKQAYNYLSRFKGLAHLFSFYDVIHTLSFAILELFSQYDYRYTKTSNHICLASRHFYQ